MCTTAWEGREGEGRRERRPRAAPSKNRSGGRRAWTHPAPRVLPPPPSRVGPWRTCVPDCGVGTAESWRARGWRAPTAPRRRPGRFWSRPLAPRWPSAAPAPSHRTHAFCGCARARPRRRSQAPKPSPHARPPTTTLTSDRSQFTQQPPRLYPADDAPKPLRRRSVAAPAKLRASLQPGTVVILLAGRFKGKRAVLLKALPSGLLLVTGPFAVNGVPLRRVNAAYVIATSTKVDVSGVDTSKLDDAFFKAAEPAKPKKGAKKEADFFAGGDDGAAAKKAELKPEFVAAQKAVDAALTAALGELKGYLATPFSLSKGDRPHLMKF